MKNVYFNTALASPDNVVRFIEKIGHERILLKNETGVWKSSLLADPGGQEETPWIRRWGDRELRRQTDKGMKR